MSPIEDNCISENSLASTLDMAKRAGQIGFGLDLLSCGSNRLRIKTDNFKRVKNGFGSSGLRVGSG